MFSLRDAHGAAEALCDAPVQSSRQMDAVRMRSGRPGPAGGSGTDHMAAIEVAEAIARANGQPLLAARLGMVRALTLQDEGKRAAAMAAAAEALHTAAEPGLRRPGQLFSGCRQFVLPCGPLASSPGAASYTFVRGAAGGMTCGARPVAPAETRGALPDGLDPLSSREREVLKLLGRALSAKSIARVLHLSAGTVKWHLRNVYSKLHASSREEALARARELRIVD